MASSRARISNVRRFAGIGFALLFLPVFAIGAMAASGGQANLAAVREATAKFHDLAAAKAAGYAEFYVCTDNESLGAAMGQHYVNINLVLDPAIDPLRPEALVYEPKKGGGYQLVGVEYVTFQEAYHDAFGANATPSVLGQPLKAVGAPNRYGLPPFFQRHVWLWSPNPLGMYEDWNSKVSCRGNGDPA
jgi:hypothetical protein